MPKQRICQDKNIWMLYADVPDATVIVAVTAAAVITYIYTCTVYVAFITFKPSRSPAPIDVRPVAWVGSNISVVFFTWRFVICTMGDTIHAISLNATMPR